MKKLELEAEKYARSFDKNLYGYDGENLSVEDEKQMQDFIAGATSNAAKDYWYKQFEKQKLEFAIEQLKSHIEHSTKPGYKRHDILNKIKELEQKLKELENEQSND